MILQPGKITITAGEFLSDPADNMVIVRFDIKYQATITRVPDNPSICSILMMWTFIFFDEDDDKLGDYVTEQMYYVTYPNENVAYLRFSIGEILDTSLRVTREEFDWIKAEFGSFEKIKWELVHFSDKDIDDILYLLSQEFK
jgi:hypothetical protein